MKETVDIIRCRNCEHRADEPNEYGSYHCYNVGFVVSPDWFCADCLERTCDWKDIGEADG